MEFRKAKRVPEAGAQLGLGSDGLNSLDPKVVRSFYELPLDER
jgi:hypothetical protein